MSSELKPGSDEAIAAGCTCPVLDNGHGKGYMGQPDVFVYTANCPVHDPDGDIFRQLKELLAQRDPLPHSEDDA